METQPSRLKTWLADLQRDYGVIYEGLRLVIIIGFMAIALRIWEDQSPSVPVMLVFSLVIWFGILFVHNFTGDLGSKHESNEEKMQALQSMVRFSYAFTLIAIVIPAVPFLMPTGDLPALNNGAFSVIEGCARSTDQNAAAKNISCDPPQQAPVQASGLASGQEAADQDEPASSYWLVNIGGSVATTATGQQIFGGLVVPLYIVVIALLGGAVSMTRRIPEIQKQVWLCIRYDLDDLDLQLNQAQQAYNRAARALAQHEVNQDRPDAPDSLQDPEQEQELRRNLEDCRLFLDALHKQADITQDPNSPMAAHKTLHGPAESTIPISLLYARERFTFQIMQVVSAPIIAMVAYHVVAPETDAASMAIAFISGFASEAVLRAIRAVSDKILPASETGKKTTAS